MKYLDAAKAANSFFLPALKRQGFQTQEVA
jgi:hypothetical protein